MSGAIYLVLLISQKDYELFHATKLNAGCWILDSRYSILDAPVVAEAMADKRFWILDAGCWMRDDGGQGTEDER